MKLSEAMHLIRLDGSIYFNTIMRCITLFRSCTDNRFSFGLFGWILVLLYTCTPCSAQQLVLLKREKVVARWEEGELIGYKMKSGEKGVSRIRELHEFFLFTDSADTIWYHQIAHLRSYQRRSPGLNLGGALFSGGLMVLGVDLINNAFFVPGGARFSIPLAPVMAMSTAVGGAILFLKPKYQRTRGRVIKKVDDTSPFFKST